MKVQPAKFNNIIQLTNTMPNKNTENKQFEYRNIDLNLYKTYPVISFQGRSIDGVIYSNSALKLGDQKLTPNEVRELYSKNLEKISQIQQLRNTAGYTNSKTGVLDTATVIGENGKTYTASNIDFLSSRSGIPAGLAASTLAIKDFNNTIKAMAITNLDHEIETLRWLVYKGHTQEEKRSSRNLQLITEEVSPAGTPVLKVQTLYDYSVLIPKNLTLFAQSKPVFTESLNAERNINVKEIKYSKTAQEAANHLERKLDIDVDKLIKDLVIKNQEATNNLDDKILNSGYNNAPASNCHYIASVFADDQKIYTGYNVEYYNNGISNKSICAEQVAILNAVNNGANRVYAMALNNNHKLIDDPCGICLEYLSRGRAGNDLLIARIERDKDKNKTDKIIVNTLYDLMPHARKK